MSDSSRHDQQIYNVLTLTSFYKRGFLPPRCVFFAILELVQA